MGFLEKLFGSSSTKEEPKLENVKLAVIYYSSTGTNYQMAQWAAEGAKEAGAEVKVLKVPETAPQAAIDSNPAWKANKVVSAMTSAQNPHGGQEQTILSLYTTMHHWGAIIASPGYTDPVIFGSGGNPYGTSVTVDQDGNMVEDVQATVKHQAKRTVTVAEWVKKGNQ